MTIDGTGPDPQALAADAAARWAELTGHPRHDVALVMGSGWVPAADALGAAETEVSVTDLPGFLPPAVAGHAGRVRSLQVGSQRVMVLLDSMHTHEHVLAELEAYAPLVSVGSYCVVFDTFVEDMPKQFFADRPWDVANNPKTATWQYLNAHPEFAIDASIPKQLMVTVAPDGFLKRLR